ncbi:MAG: hypothetical protein ACK2U1_08375 [Anaerolineales bacterium]
MRVYPVSTHSGAVTWPEPIEPIYQMLPVRGVQLAGYKRSDLSLADRLFIAAVVNLPAERRPWGSITWLADVFNTSRPTVYAIGERGYTGIQALSSSRTCAPALSAKTSSVARHPLVAVTPHRIQRTILTLLFPGKVSGRDVAKCLATALDTSRSNATVSLLLHEAGRRAGEILEKVDHSPLGPVVIARDEMFTGRNPNLLLVEPHSLVITGLYATQDREAETWACALLLTQDRGVQITGLAEDGCIPYAASCRAAGLDAAIQRDTWHPLYDTSRVVGDVKREARRLQKAAAKLEKKLTTSRWTDTVFTKWTSLIEHSEALLQQAERLRFWQDCLRDAVEVVDLPSGEIRNAALNQWLLDETLTALQQFDHARIQALTKKLLSQAPDWLTFMNSLMQPLADWQARTAQYFPDPRWAAFFQSTIARLWRLEHAVRNGHRQYLPSLAEARLWVAEFVTDDPTAYTLAQDLLNLLERVVRTSSAAEAINSVLRPFVNSRREATDQTSRQLFLNLFCLWFNMHKFDRGPRSGKSPYQLAGIDLGTDDWLTLLGYPPD